MQYTNDITKVEKEATELWVCKGMKVWAYDATKLWASKYGQWVICLKKYAKNYNEKHAKEKNEKGTNGHIIQSGHEI